MKKGQVIKLRNPQASYPNMDLLVGRKYRVGYTVSRDVDPIHHYKGWYRDIQPQDLKVIDDRLTDESKAYINSIVNNIRNWRPAEFVEPQSDVVMPVIFSQSMRNFFYEKQSQSRIAKLLHNVIERYRTSFDYRLHPNFNIMKLIFTTEDINYITYRNNGMISYMPSNKVQQFRESGEWVRDGRQEGKPSKVIRKIFTKKAQNLFSPKDYEIFNNLYQSQYNTDNLVFKVESKGNIGSVYDEYVDENSHSLGSSCMRGQGHYMRLYERATDCVGIVTCRDKASNAFMGRAMLWNVTETDDSGNVITVNREPVKFTFMDRVYATSDQTAQAFIDYAKSQGWYTKVKFQSRSNSNFLQPPSSEVEPVYKYMRVAADQDDLEYYPYIDTFQYGDGCYLYNQSNGYDYEYDCTGGGRTYNNESLFVDEITQQEYDSDDNFVTIDRGRYRNSRTHIENAVNVHGYYYWIDDSAICQLGNGDYATSDECVWSNRMQEYLLVDDAYYIEAIDDYVDEDMALFDDEIGKYILND